MAQNASDGGHPVRRTLWRIAATVGALIALFGLGGFLGMPPLLRHVMTGPVAAALNRPVQVGDIGVNPYTLKVDIDQLQIGERGAPQPFVEVSHLHLKLSWASLFRLTLMVEELCVWVCRVLLLR